MALPDIKDEEGFVVERSFSSSLATEEDEDFFKEYDVPLNDHTFTTLPKAISCSFEDKTELGKRILLLNMKVKGTPYLGYAYISEDFYTIR